MSDQGSVVIVGGTSEMGKEVGKSYADQGRTVVLTSRDVGRAQAAAADVGGDTTGLALDLAEPTGIANALAGVDPVDRLVLVAVDRDENTVKDYDIAAAISLVTLKLVGYTEVIHTLVGRMGDDSSIVLYGGLAKERPYPGSTTVTTINGGVTAMIRTLAVELAPIRVNAIHPAVVGDSPYWANKPAEVMDALRARTPLGELVSTANVVDATIFLLENSSITGVNLPIDGGWLLV